MTAHKIKSFITQNWIFYLIAFTAVFGLKYFYSRAGSSELQWILAPTAWWVGILSGIPFENIPDIGFVNHSLRFIIAPSCSGLQFMSITVAALICTFVHRMKTAKGKLVWTVLCLGFSFLFTVFVNGIRIVFAIYLPLYLFKAGVPDGWLTPERLHTAIGVVIYFTSLSAVCRGAEYVSRKAAAPSRSAQVPVDRRNPTDSQSPAGSLRQTLRGFVPPMFWYFSIVLGIPLLNRAYRREGNQFAEYAILLTAICLILIALFCLAALIRKYTGRRTH